MWVRHTRENGSGLWPTPTDSMVTVGDMEQARYAGNDPKRPKYVDANKSWPTPQMRDYKNQHGQDSDAFNKRKEHKRGVNLVEENQRRGNIGQLNPDWVAWLMGFPIGWTSLEPMTEMIWLDWSVDPADLEEPDNYATPRSRKWTSERPEVWQIRKNKGDVSTPPLAMQAQLKPSTGPIPRVATGIKDRVNRLKALGNGQVPLCAATAWEVLKP